MRLRRAGIEAGWFDEDQAAAAESQAREEVAAAVEFARASSFPSPERAADLVYAEGSG